jgi:nicotinamide riboside transporter PnuC
MKIVMFLLIAVLFTSPLYAGVGHCIYQPNGVITHLGDYAWDKEEQKKIEKMTEKEYESYKLNKWFEQNKERE